MSTPVTAVLVGAGNRGLDGYGDLALRRPEEFQIVAACDPLARRRQLAQTRHNLPDDRLFYDWSDLLKHDRLADAVIVATPDTGHVEPTLALLKHGYHVLLEKPMALSERECWRLVRQSRASDRILTVCHVLRYAPYFREMKRFLETGRLGKIYNVRHFEPVNWWRFAHSFVRGNWRRKDQSCPFILSKCCHDFDIFAYLIEKPCRKVSSFGSLSHFKAENKPPDTASRCLDCRLADSGCVYSAKRYYGELLRTGQHDWPVNVVVDEFTAKALDKALKQGPYGRCVYDCDNDVVDHQVVAMEFEDGITATFTASAFTDHRVRETEIQGSLGSLRGDGTHLEFCDFETRERESWEVKSSGRHLGGDDAMIDSFLRAVRSGDGSLLDTGPVESVASHLMAFAAERSRITGETEEIRLLTIH